MSHSSQSGGFFVGVMIMRFFAKRHATQSATKLPKDHECYGCVWANYHDEKVVCVRMPCVRNKPARK
ncbi:hypothetical protein [Brevibacillus centrosporus]|uniref:hypothetical protein n=1 Tax=Brevibacillus centrosporus TaxID=54910 RepID=UPI002E236E63|nr:hypothetical protein [Brevibacillus centrosporus]